MIAPIWLLYIWSMAIDYYYVAAIGLVVVGTAIFSGIIGRTK